MRWMSENPEYSSSLKLDYCQTMRGGETTTNKMASHAEKPPSSSGAAHYKGTPE